MDDCMGSFFDERLNERYGERLIPGKRHSKRHGGRPGGRFYCMGDFRVSDIVSDLVGKFLVSDDMGDIGEKILVRDCMGDIVGKFLEGDGMGDFAKRLRYANFCMGDHLLFVSDLLRRLYERLAEQVAVRLVGE